MKVLSGQAAFSLSCQGRGHVLLLFPLVRSSHSAAVSLPPPPRTTSLSELQSATCHLPLAISVFAPMTNAQMKNQTVRPVRSCRISTICECKTVGSTPTPTPCAVSSGFILLIYGCILRFARYYVDLLALSPAWLVTISITKRFVSCEC